MKSKWFLGTAPAIVLTACVTINVYFPAAEAKEAAKEFVEGVIGSDGKPVDQPASKPGGMSAFLQMQKRVDLWSVVGIGSAYAQSKPDITIRTPAIQSIQSRMASRFDSSLRAAFDAGALGFGADGMIVVRDADKLALKDRVAVNAAVADDNRDRKALYREVAVANDHPEWETQIRQVFARQWIDSARSGWWYQSGGSWKQK
ncbi:YdbL family protein [Lysobacter soyae]|uniref:YdbL family protein n=1 Tax=Lysobacter soyae TaxID=2764185 RepID=A0ABX8WM76_9GAMM|nr:YdbL family protein [Lysobacter sp. CJ11]QYR52205.1 YdbL family protein [Lysobacter sp. CJ11]